MRNAITNEAGLRTIPIALMLGAVLMQACDTNDESRLSDTEILVGTWAITGFYDETGDRSDVIAQGFAGVHLAFAENGSGALELFAKHGPARQLATAYTIDEELNLVTMTVGVPGDSDLRLNLGYSLTNEVQSARFHTIDTATLNTLFESDLQGDVEIVASKFGEEGVVE